MIPEIKRPSECTARELEDFACLVAQGGQVARSGLEQRIRRAKYLAFAYVEGELAAVAAVKKASWFYIRDVFGKANEPARGNDFKYELGWGYTRPKYRNRGIHQCLVDLLLENVRDINIFGTTGTANEAIMSILQKRGFVMCGSPYPGKTEAKQLWIRNGNAETSSAGWFMRIFDSLLRDAERSESFNHVRSSFRRKVKARLTGVH